MGASSPYEVDGARVPSISWVDISDDLSSGRRENPSGRVHRWIDPVATDDQIGSHRSGVKSTWHGPLSMVRIAVIFDFCDDDQIRMSCQNVRIIWAICGTGFLLDIMWLQAFGLSLSNIQREFGFSDKQSGNISSAFFAGEMAGAFVWGVLIDVVGSLSI